MSNPPTRLTVVSDQGDGDAFLGIVWEHLKNPTTAATYRERCKNPHDLIRAVTAHYKAGQAIDVLDIVGHGRRGLIRLGTDVLFSSTNDPNGLTIAHRDILPALNKCLAPNAQLRLLGCSVAHTANPQTHQEGNCC